MRLWTGPDGIFHIDRTAAAISLTSSNSSSDMEGMNDDGAGSNALRSCLLPSRNRLTRPLIFLRSLVRTERRRLLKSSLLSAPYRLPSWRKKSSGNSKQSARRDKVSAFTSVTPPSYLEIFACRILLSAASLDCVSPRISRASVSISGLTDVFMPSPHLLLQSASRRYICVWTIVRGYNWRYWWRLPTIQICKSTRYL